MANSIVDTYSKLARTYDDLGNLESCWGRAANDAAQRLEPPAGAQLIADIGCGTGHALLTLARRVGSTARLVGVEPAAGMRERAVALVGDLPNVEIVNGSFEETPLDDDSVDFLYSIFAFHWSTDIERAVAELSRVVRANGAMDLCFIGRDNGREFIRATSGIFLRYLGAQGLLDAARMRKQLTREQAQALFARLFEPGRVEVTETRKTYYDTLDGHWSWWVRIEGQFVAIPEEARDACGEEVRQALASLETNDGIPYTLHELRVRLVQH